MDKKKVKKKSKSKKNKKNKILLWGILILIILITIPFALLFQKTIISTKKPEIRQAVFAGTWYPAEPSELENLTRFYLGNSEQLELNGAVRALIVPHAGYLYSGQIAGAGFKQLNKDYESVFLIGPSHRYPLKDTSVSDFDYYSTPLGNVKVSEKAEKISREKIVKNVEEAHANEHCLEIELPFLQEQLKDSDFEIVPILVGPTNTEEFKEILKKYLDKNDLIVVSVDLSHYHEYNEALLLDSYSLKNILDLNHEAILNSEIDAPWAVSSLLKLAKEKSWKPYLIAYTNSGVITGNKTGVVGYSAIVFVEEYNLNAQEKEYLLNLARESAENYLKKNKKIEIKEEDVPEKLKTIKGCFVTFTDTREGKLRGCIGHILPQKPLYECVIENSINAAINDKRFNPITFEELKSLKIDISILSVPALLEHDNPEELLSKLKQGEQGVILKQGVHQSTYLPSVWNQIPDKEEFLTNLCIKGNMEEGCWKDSKTEIYVYDAFDFSE